MARPTRADVRPVGNPLLTSMLIAFMNEDDSYVARRAAPVVPVTEESGTYVTIDTNHWFADKQERRAYGDTFPQSGYTYGSDTYITQQWGLEHPIPDELAATSQVPMTLETVGLRWLAEQSNIRKERAFAADFMASSVWDTDATPTDWDDASGVPITDSGTARRTIRQAGAGTANAIVMGEIVHDALLVNAQLLDYLKYTRTMTVTERDGLLAAALGFDLVLVSRAVYNSANTGQTASLSAIIDDDALVCVVQPGVDMFGVSSVKTFAWGPGGGEGEALTYRAQDRKSDILQHSEQWDQKLISSAAGYFFPDIV